MDKRHVADYKPHIQIGGEDIARLRPWIAVFARDALRILGKAAPAGDRKSMLECTDDFEKIRLE